MQFLRAKAHSSAPTSSSSSAASVVSSDEPTEARGTADSRSDRRRCPPALMAVARLRLALAPPVVGQQVGWGSELWGWSWVASCHRRRRRRRGRRQTVGRALRRCAPTWLCRIGVGLSGAPQTPGRARSGYPAFERGGVGLGGLCQALKRLPGSAAALQARCLKAAGSRGRQVGWGAGQRPAGPGRSTNRACGTAMRARPWRQPHMQEHSTQQAPPSTTPRAPPPRLQPLQRATHHSTKCAVGARGPRRVPAGVPPPSPSPHPCPGHPAACNPHLRSHCPGATSTASSTEAGAPQQQLIGSERAAGEHLGRCQRVPRAHTAPQPLKQT